MNELNYTCISIHAPPRGATVELSAITGLPYISIHAPPRGATIHPRHVLDPEQFQFTPLREGRLPAPEVADAPEGISIHAPPRGATRGVKCIVCSQQISIHAPPRGATGCCRGRCSARAISIHAPPRGATDGGQHLRQQIILFQFTPLREGRLLQPPCALVVDISIHAPPRGATKNKNAFLGGIDISIHAPPRGATSPCLSS